MPNVEYRRSTNIIIKSNSPPTNSLKSHTPLQKQGPSFHLFSSNVTPRTLIYFYFSQSDEIQNQLCDLNEIIFSLFYGITCDEERVICVLILRDKWAEDSRLGIWRWEKEFESAKDCCGVYLQVWDGMGWEQKCPLSETGRKRGRMKEGGSVSSVPQTL
jgi:hypothetical protein